MKVSVFGRTLIVVTPLYLVSVGAPGAAMAVLPATIVMTGLLELRGAMNDFSQAHHDTSAQQEPPSIDSEVDWWEWVKRGNQSVGLVNGVIALGGFAIYTVGPYVLASFNGAIASLATDDPGVGCVVGGTHFAWVLAQSLLTRS